MILLLLTVVVTLAVQCYAKTDDEVFLKLLKKLISKDDEKADDKRALTNIAVTSTSISGYPQDWGVCPELDCTYVVSCGIAGSKEVEYGQKVEFNNLKPDKSYTCTICLKGEQPRKCSNTAWVCKTQSSANSVNNLLDAPCRSKYMSDQELAKRETLSQLEELLAQLEK